MIRLPELQGPTTFKGPFRRRYSVEQFAASYIVSEAMVVMWIERGFLGAVHKGRCEEATGDYIILERHRLDMVRWFGSPDNPKTKLPIQV